MTLPKAQRVVFRPPVPLAEARRLIAAALDDEGLALMTNTSGNRPAIWASLDRGALTVYIDPRAVIARPFPKEDPTP